MGVLSSLVSSLTAFYPKSLDPNRSAEQINGTIIRALAKLPTLAAWSFKNRMRQPIMYPKNSLSYTANFIQMMFGLPTEETEVNPIVSKALDKLLMYFSASLHSFTLSLYFECICIYPYQCNFNY